MAKKKLSKTWLHQHLNDPYVKEAQQRGYRARAAFKLKEILEAEKLLKPGDVVIDLGAAPGSWSQVVSEGLRGPDGRIHGRIIALDCLPMEAIADVEFIQGDFRDDAVLTTLEDRLQGQKVDLVISDMAPNLSGVKAADSARMAHLLELALDFAVAHLKPDGVLIAKAFHGSGYSQIVSLLRGSFRHVASRKPGASRDKSAETYLVARGLR